MITIKKRINNKKINNDDLVLDIETTGLDFNKDKLVLLGLVKKIKDKVYIFQYFAESDDEEIRLLEIYTREVKNKRLVTYNGDIFDIGFLNSRLEQNHKFPLIIESSLDIYRVIKNKSKFFTYDSMRLMDIEKMIGINREDPSRYKVISKLSEDINKRTNPYPILKHNENDLIATALLVDIEQYYREKLSIKTDFGTLYFENAIINKDIGNFIFYCDENIEDAYLVENNYQLIIENNKIILNLHVLYGSFDEENSGYVAINTLNIPNNSSLDININLLIIYENNIYAYKNLLNLCKKIIEDLL